MPSTGEKGRPQGQVPKAMWFGQAQAGSKAASVHLSAAEDGIGNF